VRIRFSRLLRSSDSHRPVREFHARAVGGSFLLTTNSSRRPFPKSHQLRWWIVHTQPTKQLAAPIPRIPPTQLVDCSYSAYKTARGAHSPNPTNAVGGLFILSLQNSSCSRDVFPNPTNAVGGLFTLGLQNSSRRPFPESHQRSWWIVHTQPNPVPEEKPLAELSSALHTSRRKPRPAIGDLSSPPLTRGESAWR